MASPEKQKISLVDAPKLIFKMSAILNFLDEAELIHMNGRVYDYNLGRFLSVDPFIQGAGNSQAINPYSYVLNNPLSGTDPSGYSRLDTANGSITQGSQSQEDAIEEYNQSVMSANITNAGIKSQSKDNGAGDSKGASDKKPESAVDIEDNNSTAKKGSTSGKLKGTGKGSGGGSEITGSQLDYTLEGVDAGIVRLNNFIGTLQDGEGDEFDQIVSDYGFNSAKDFEETRTFLIGKARGVASLMAEYKSTQGAFIRSSADYGDADTPGKVALGNMFFKQKGLGSRASTLIHEFAHKVWTPAETRFNVRSAYGGLNELSQQARRYSIAPAERANIRNFIRNSSYRFEYSTERFSTTLRSPL